MSKNDAVDWRIALSVAGQQMAEAGRAIAQQIERDLQRKGIAVKPDHSELQEAVTKVNLLIRDYAHEHSDTKEVKVKLFDDPDGPAQLQVDIVHLHARMM